jgi:hypothetical protein
MMSANGMMFPNAYPMFGMPARPFTPINQLTGAGGTNTLTGAPDMSSMFSAFPSLFNRNFPSPSAFYPEMYQNAGHHGGEAASPINYTPTAGTPAGSSMMFAWPPPFRPSSTSAFAPSPHVPAATLPATSEDTVEAPTTAKKTTAPKSPLKSRAERLANKSPRLRSVASPLGKRSSPLRSKAAANALNEKGKKNDEQDNKKQRKD